MRRMMLKSAFLKVRNKLTATHFAANLTEQDLVNAIDKRKKGNQPMGAAGNFIRAVDAVTTSVPHSNDAARKARRDSEAFAHHFGIPSYFLSVTPDDETSFFILVYSLNSSTHCGFDPNNMNDEELGKYATLRHKLRIEFPGLCAYFFEKVLSIVIKYVVGWDEEANGPMPEGGIFGTPIAYTAAVEEQGRRSLHAHILIWIANMSELQEGIYSDNIEVSTRSKRKLEQLADEVISTELMTADNCEINRNTKWYGRWHGTFPHNCRMQHDQRRKRPKVVNDQSLRNLRNRRGPINCDGPFAYCTQCTKIWSSTSLLSSYLRDNAKIPHFSIFPDDPQRLKSIVLAYQMTKDRYHIPQYIVDAAYNFHIHTNSCFPSKKGHKRKRDNDSNDNSEEARGEECCYRYPRRMKKATTIQPAGKKIIKWYSWDGTYKLRNMHEINMKRNEYDSFQNDCCRVISRSKIGCNTNAAQVIPGLVAGYQFKYQIKATNEDDTEPYTRVARDMRKVLEQRKHDSDNSESLRRLLAASYSHQKTGIVGSAMAAYLTRHKTRFKFSHQTIWCPL